MVRSLPNWAVGLTQAWGSTPLGWYGREEKTLTTLAKAKCGLVTQRRGFSAWVTSGETMTAEAFVWVSLERYLGVAMKVISPVLASSMEATPKISTSPSPMTLPPTH